MNGGLRVAVVTACLLTAGCAGLFGGGSTATETVTPAPVPTDASTARADPLAPGVSEGGVFDARALARAHVTHLSNTSYTVRHTTTVRNESGLVYRQETGAEIAAGYRTYRASRTVTDRNGTAREIHLTWRNGRAVQRTTENGTTTREIVADGRGIGGPPRPPRDAMFFEPTFHDRIGTLFGNLRGTSVQPNETILRQLSGASIYRIRATGIANDSAAATVPADGVSNATVAASIAPNGVVRSYTLQYTGTRDGATVRVTERLRYNDIGSTTVEFDGG